MEMDIGKEEANLIYEERQNPMSLPNDEEDEDEDNHRELEELLYSHVFYDNGSISADEPPSVQGIVIQSISVEAPPKPGSASENLDASPHVRLPVPCLRSQFNNPNRKKASRYYDVSQIKKKPESTFVAPHNPCYKPNRNASENSEFSVPSLITSRIWARSNEIIYQPSRLRNRKEMGKKEGNGAESVDVSSFHSMSEGNPAQQGNCSNLRTVPVIDGREESINKDKETLVSKVTDNVLCTGDKHVLTKTLEDGWNRKAKGSKDDLPQKKNLQTFEAKIKNVISSMLDEESRSSADDNQSVSNYPSHELKNLNSDSGWSIGMSWDDMSSKYNFEVDSLEDESVSSLQMQESSTPAGSRTQTPDILPHCPEKANDGEEAPEASKYNLNLKSNENQAEQHCETDSESEVGSIVEVPPPVKPAPPLVDISDGEFAPVLGPTKEKSSVKGGRDISVLFSRSKSSPMGPISELIIDSSSDDDLVVLDVINTPGSGNNIVLEGSKKRNLLNAQEKHTMEEGIPSKRQSQNQYNLRKKISTEGSESLGGTSAASSDVNDLEKLELWLRNPIKSSKYMDHHKFLKKMSDDPSLWQISWADKTNMPSQRGPKCLNCNQFGHKAKVCRAPRKIVHCHMCGAPGHSESRCTQKMCLRCGRKNNIFTDRCRNCASNSTPCKICSSLTHTWKCCPDLWRRFHLTTTSCGEMVTPRGTDIRPRSEQWCSNCAAKGHLSHECSKAQWKCESISPFIKSYATPTAEEEQLEGRSTAAMLLTEGDAAVLNTAEGKQFLLALVEKYQVILNPSLDTYFKKVVIDGFTLSQEKVRNDIRNWIFQQRRSKTLQSNIAESEYVSQQKISTQKEPKHNAQIQFILRFQLPKKLNNLVPFLDDQLQVIQNPILHDLNVEELFNSVSKLSMKDCKHHKKLLRQHCRLLNIILIGKCGFCDGHQHVQALKHLAEVARERNSDVSGSSDISSLRVQIAEHFSFVLSGGYREDYRNLVRQFYLDKTLVKQHDTVPIGHESPEQQSEGQSQTSKKKKKELLCVSSDDELILDNAQRNEDLIPSCTNDISLPQAQNQEIAPSASVDDLKSASSARAEQKSYSIDDMPLAARQNEQGSERKKIKNSISQSTGLLRRKVPIVLKNLTSRFLSSKEQTKLASGYRLLFKSQTKVKGREKRILVKDMMKLTNSLCKRYNIPFQ